MGTESEYAAASKSFVRLAKAVRMRDICREPQGTWDLESPDSLTISEAMQRLLKEESGMLDLHRPILLRAPLQGESGTPVMQGGFPYGVWFPDRAVRHAVAENDAGEHYIEYEDLEDEWLDAGRGISVAEFCERLLVGGDHSLWELLSDQSQRLHSSEAMLVVLGGGRFGVVTLEDFLQSAEAKACWLALVLDLERAALEVVKLVPLDAIIQLPKKRQDALARLMEARVKAAGSKRAEQFRHERTVRAMTEIFANRKKHPHWLLPVFLEHTMLCDKKRMILAAAPSLDLPKSQVKRVFEDAERLRNWCAHPTSVPELDVKTLGALRGLVSDIAELIEKLNARTAQPQQPPAWHRS
jgi:hypothetical protein